MSRQSKIRIGVIGCSAIAQRSVIPALQKQDICELVGVASRSKSKALEVANEFNCQPYTYDDILKEADIDAIYISLPVGLHYKWAKKALEAKKHVLLEKTFTEKLEQARELFSIAQAKKLVLTEALMYLYHPLISKVQEVLPEIGTVRHIQGVFGFPGFPSHNIRNSKEIGGGALLDSCIYPLSLVLKLLGNHPAKVSSNIIWDDDNDVDARGFLQLDYREASAQIAYGTGFIYRNEYTLWGTEGYIQVSRAFSRPPDFTNSISLVKQNDVRQIQVEAKDQFEEMTRVFIQEIAGKNKQIFDKKDDVLSRIKLISEIKGAL